MQDYNRSISFTSRCPQIRQAEWICHAVNTKLPHRSSSKLNPMVFKFMDRNSVFLDMYDKFDFTGKMVFLQNCTLQERKIISTDKSIANLNMKINSLRQHNHNIHCLFDSAEPIVKKVDVLGRKIFDTSFLEEKKARVILKLLKVFKVGNCAETAKASEIVLKMNGMKNVYNASMIYENQFVDHRVCMFNIDGSEYSGIINNKTVIVDPWAGFADFANNAFIRYRNVFKEHLGLDRSVVLDDKGKFNLYRVTKIDLSEKAIDSLKKSYPELVFKKGSTN